MADIVAAGDFGEGLAVLAPRPCFLLLMMGELRRASEFYAPRLGSLAAFPVRVRIRSRSNSARHPLVQCVE